MEPQLLRSCDTCKQKRLLCHYIYLTQFLDLCLSKPRGSSLEQKCGPFAPQRQCWDISLTPNRQTNISRNKRKKQQQSLKNRKTHPIDEWTPFIEQSWYLILKFSVQVIISLLFCWFQWTTPPNSPAADSQFLFVALGAEFYDAFINNTTNHWMCSCIVCLSESHPCILVTLSRILRCVKTGN